MITASYRDLAGAAYDPTGERHAAERARRGWMAQLSARLGVKVVQDGAVIYDRGQVVGMACSFVAVDGTVLGGVQAQLVDGEWKGVATRAMDLLDV